MSVLLTSYNYKDVVAKAIRSVALSGYRDHELVVVDDASTDGSAAVIEAELSRYPWLPVQLIVRGRNRGLAAARNLAAQHARGEYVFILDADNFVYPHALGRLVDALDARPRGRVRLRDPRGVHLTGRDRPQELARLGPAAAALRQLRGRDVDDPPLARSRRPAATRRTRALYGWEDFALWCALAERGQRGVLVPEILAALPLVDRVDDRAHRHRRIGGLVGAARPPRDPARLSASGAAGP